MALPDRLSFNFTQRVNSINQNPNLEKFPSKTDNIQKLKNQGIIFLNN